MLGFRRGGGGGFFDADGVGPLGNEGVACFHRHPGILHKHLRAFAAAPGQIVEEVIPIDVGVYGDIARWNNENSHA